MKVSREEIESAKTLAGGWKRATLAKWGVPWPPPKGWRYALESGTPMPTRKAKRKNPDWYPAWVQGQNMNREMRERIEREP